MTNRRKRLYVAALVRTVLPTYGAECDAIEAYADRRITYATFRAAHLEALQRHGVTAEAARDSIDVKRKRWLLGDMFHREAEQGRSETWGRLRQSQYGDDATMRRRVDHQRDAVLWCFSDKHRVSPQHVTATVHKLALAIYADKDFAAMPILADALEDAGLPVDYAAMRHCRDTNAMHWRGCCVIDSILGRLDK